VDVPNDYWARPFIDALSRVVLSVLLVIIFDRIGL